MTAAVDLAAQAATLEQILKDRGLIDDEFIDSIVQEWGERVGPRNGARAVARAWLDDGYRARLLADGKAAVEELGFAGPENELVVLENTPAVHNVVVCTLCSCYPTSVLGLPPRWYKSNEYRARVVREPRTVLREMGLDLGADVELRVWDSTAEKRYLVLPVRPADTAGLGEDALAALVTRDGMIGVAAV